MAIEKVFIQMMPRTAPRRGKRLDTRWGEFGILASQYFAPLRFGTPAPTSLREAWARIDQSILYFVYGKSEDALTIEEREKYKLVGDELEVASHSTLSDWHKKGLLRLLEMIRARENYLAKILSMPAVIVSESPALGTEQTVASEKKNLKTNFLSRFVNKPSSMLWLFAFILLVLVIAGGFKAWKIYNLALVVKGDASHLQLLVRDSSASVERLKQVGPALSTLHTDFAMFKAEIDPFLGLGPWFGWVPLYGNEIASIEDLVSMTDSLLASADISYSVIVPVLDEYETSGINLPRMAIVLGQAHEQLLEAQSQMVVAVKARERLQLERFSPYVRELILEDIDPLLSFLNNGLVLAVEAPRLLGATEEGPKTYLLLVQNEDELRPTGGFITAAGTLLVQGGRISDLTFENSGDLDNWSLLYPSAPWQLRQYMNSPVLVLRDANWFTNYPTAALYAEYLYSYISAHSVDGVIAFDQQMLVELLRATGPVVIEGEPTTIDAGNVITYMRTAKTPTPDEVSEPSWNNKAFINKITRALVAKIFAGEVEWGKLAKVLQTVLDERHLLFQVDNPAVTSLLVRYNWDGAVRPDVSDFLMAVDSNVGFNKTNAVVETSLFYDIDLTNYLEPVSSLTVVHKNNGKGVLVCKQWNKIRLPGEKDYPITDCYWNYLRLYVTKGARLLESTPQYIPSSWMIRGEGVPARVDTLQDEEVAGVEAFGTLQVVPIGESIASSFRFALPSSVVTRDPGSDKLTYHLKVQKQPGTLAIPLTIRVHLSNAAEIDSIPENAIIQDANVFLETNLRTDVDFQIIFGLP
jgi:hypothetical protein